MDVMDFLVITFQPINIVLIMAGLMVGIIFGMLPGLSGVTAIAVLTPFSYGMSPIQGLVLMSSIYCGAVYSGSISAILFNSPGDTPAVCTSLDGYPMALKGQAGRALSAAMMSSGIGGLIGVIIAMIGAASLVRVALRFASPEYFALGVLGLSLVATIGSKSVSKGVISVCLGLFAAYIGLDPVTGISRFTFKTVNLMAGVSFIPAIIGLFAVAEVFRQFAQIAERKKLELSKGAKLDKVRLLSTADIKLCLPHWARNSLLGTFIGMLPGAGATIAAILGYGLSRQVSKNQKLFGEGALEGVAGPEVANNAAVGGAMVPLLTLGIPGSATTALILNVFLIHGLQPGPLLFVRTPELMYPIFIGMLFTNLLIIFVPLFIVKHIVKVLHIPYVYLGTTILFLCIIGAFTLNNRIYDVWVVFIFGIIGFLMARYDFSPAALVLGLVLGRLIEDGFRKALVMFGGNILEFTHRPIALGLLIFAFLLLASPAIKLLFKLIFKNKPSQAAAS